MPSAVNGRPSSPSEHAGRRFLRRGMASVAQESGQSLQHGAQNIHFLTASNRHRKSPRYRNTLAAIRCMSHARCSSPGKRCRLLPPAAATPRAALGAGHCAKPTSPTRKASRLHNPGSLLNDAAAKQPVGNHRSPNMIAGSAKV